MPGRFQRHDEKEKSAGAADVERSARILCKKNGSARAGSNRVAVFIKI